MHVAPHEELCILQLGMFLQECMVISVLVSVSCLTLSWVCLSLLYEFECLHVDVPYRKCSNIGFSCMFSQV